MNLHDALIYFTDKNLPFADIAADGRFLQYDFSVPGK